jgi:two-component system, NarL family, nitrate/nitrite response regulator NarL
MSEAIRLFVVDDHALFCQGLVRLLDDDPVFRIVGSAGSVEAALEQVPAAAPDVLILDYDLGGDTALTLVRALREQGLNFRTLMVTAGLPDNVAMELIGLGISGIFVKQRPLGELYQAIVDVAGGKLVIEREYFQNLVASTRATADAPALTPRDRQILGFLLEGLSNKEMATNLKLSESAIKAAMQQLFAKSGVRTRSQLVRVALEYLKDEL